jgi:exopolysaccharide biosynthesis polyprenyl glycosylphosphotransferase
MGLLDAGRETLSALIFATVTVLAASAIATDPHATEVVLANAGMIAVALPGARLLLAFARRRAHSSGVLGKRTLIIGAGAIGAQLEQRLASHPELGLVTVGYLDADPSPGAERSVPVLGSPDQLESVVSESRVDYVIFAFSSAPDSEVLPLMRRCERLGLEVAVVPRLFENVNARQRIEHVGGLPLLAMHTPSPHSWQYGAKHLIDRITAGLLLTVVSPVILAAAIAVRLSSPGPVFFRQRRIGRDGKAFDLVKLRSMRSGESAGGDAVLRRRIHAAGTAPGGIEGPDRRTRVGSLLRRTSIDELPQLVNVLRGHMSLVGPRPERPEFVQLFEADLERYGDRHRVKSGITGWAQVHGLRGQTSLADRVEWDNWYIQNWSLWLDFKIMLLTPLEVVRSSSER